MHSISLFYVGFDHHAHSQPPSKRSLRTAQKSADLHHGERVIDPSTGLTKRQLAEYYDRVAGRMLPLLHDRPVALNPAPGGIRGEQFFQRNATGLAIPDIETIHRPSGKPAMLINLSKSIALSRSGERHRDTCLECYHRRFNASRPLHS